MVCMCDIHKKKERVRERKAGFLPRFRLQRTGDISVLRKSQTPFKSATGEFVLSSSKTTSKRGKKMIEEINNKMLSLFSLGAIVWLSCKLFPKNELGGGRCFGCLSGPVPSKQHQTARIYPGNTSRVQHLGPFPSSGAG